MDIESGKVNGHRNPTPLANAQHTIAFWQPKKRTIPRVPSLLRKDERNRDAYDPKAMSFGPYHYGKKELQYCQKAKHLALQKFIEGGEQSSEFFYKHVLGVVNHARESYDKGSTDKYSDEEFAEMMLLDACFLIYFMNIGDQNPHSRLMMHNYLGRLAESMIKRDIYLVENQIPFNIIMLLVKLRYNDTGEAALSKFLQLCIWGENEQDQIDKIRQELEQHRPLSLFAAFRRLLVGNWTPQDETQIPIRDEEEDVTKRFRTYRSATDMKAKGIHFRQSRLKCLRSIKFRSILFYGKLQLPTWLVDNHSRVFLLNMIAYELCPDNLVDATVISYVNFVKSLIDRPEDVKVLRDRKILLTSLGDDQEVVEFYRQLNTYGVENTATFKEVRQKIQKHYDSKAMTLMALFFHMYFSKPWSVVGWLVAIVLIALTITQTKYAIHPRSY